METNRGSQGILSEALNDKREAIVELLKTAYFMELETVMNYVTNSINPDGVRAQEVKENIEADIQEELAHAQQEKLQPPEDQIDVVHVIKGVIDAEDGAIEHYTRLIQETEEVDPVTNDMVIAILRDEQGHRRLFEGFLREYEVEGRA
jgi:bacterioferritin